MYAMGVIYGVNYLCIISGISKVEAMGLSNNIIPYQKSGTS